MCRGATGCVVVVAVVAEEEWARGAAAVVVAAAAVPEACEAAATDGCSPHELQHQLDAPHAEASHMAAHAAGAAAVGARAAHERVAPHPHADLRRLAVVQVAGTKSTRCTRSRRHRPLPDGREYRHHNWGSDREGSAGEEAAPQCHATPMRASSDRAAGRPGHSRRWGRPADAAWNRAVMVTSFVFFPCGGFFDCSQDPMGDVVFVALPSLASSAVRRLLLRRVGLELLRGGRR